MKAGSRIFLSKKMIYGIIDDKTDFSRVPRMILIDLDRNFGSLFEI